MAEKQGLLTDEHFRVDGTLIQAWASHKSFRPKDGPPSDGGVLDATSRRTGAASRAATTPTNPPPIRTRGCIARATAPRRSCVTTVTC